MRADLCLCSEIAPLTARIRFVLVMHAKEANKPTNTGFMVRAMLPSTEIRLRGRPGKTIDLADLPDAGVLFPLEEAEEISAKSAPPILIVPDGTWPQARSSVRRDMKHHRAFKLPPGAARECLLRTHRDPAAVSTIEAIARVLAIVGDRSVAEEMMRVFRMMVDRTLWIRGNLATEEVFGGIPEAVARGRGR